MTNSILINHTKKVNRVLVIAIWVITVLIVLGSLTEKTEISVGVAALIAGAAISTVLIIIKKADGLTANILCYSYLLYNVLHIVLNKSAETDIVSALVINVCFVTLYLNQKSFITFAAVFDVLSIAYIAINPAGNSGIFKPMFTVNLCLVILYFVTRWGSQLISASVEKEESANNALEELKKVMGFVKQNTFTLNGSIVESEENLQSIKEASAGIIATMQEVTRGVVEQAGSISDINTMISSADSRIGETVDISNKMSEVSSNTSEVVKEGSENIHEMDKQISIINKAISNSLTTVTELEKSMDEVNNFLGGITQIAEQTNLLALNAAIEAARAGEQGRGFAVVAEEVRKLAEQSSETVGLINTIISNIKEKTESALREVQEGTHAVQEGEAIVKKVNKSFDNIKVSFGEIDGCIAEELKIVDATSTLFKKIAEESENIASISEEHSAATEEMLATVSEQDNSIGNIFSFIKQIKNSSEELNGIAETQIQ